MEIFKDIIYCKEELKNLYQISNSGKVYSSQRKKILKTTLNNRGYEFIVLKNKNIKQKFYIHRLVAMHFLENKQNKPFINHIDCNPLNNKVENLEWVTHLENMQYASKLGRFNKTEQWKNKISDAQKKNKVYYKDLQTGEMKIFNSIQSVKKYGYEPSCVCDCCKGNRHTHKGKIWGYV